MTRKQFVVFALILGTFGGSASAQSRQRRTAPARAPVRTAPAQEWRVLLIIKPVTKLRMAGVPEVNATIAADNIEAVRRVFEQYTPELVQRMTNGRVAWKPEVVVSTHPLETVSNIGGDNHWVWASDVSKDFEEHVPLGKYDGVFVYWLGVDSSTGSGVNGGFGYSLGPQLGQRWAGYTSVHHGPTERWRRGDAQAEIFLHEWLHHLEAFYGERGVKLPKGGVHGDPQYTIPGHSPDGLNLWYQAFLNAEIPEPDGSRSGLGEQAWSLGTIREAAAVHTPDWLTPARIRTSLLEDGSFEDISGQDVKGWAVRSVQGRDRAASVDSRVSHTGRASVKLQTDPAGGQDAVCLQREQAVKPHTRYLLAGWVKISDVVNTEQKGETAGGLLTIDDAYETSAPFLGTQDWSYRTVVINSGDRTSVKIGCRLGHIGTTGRGTAWFDDLVLIELGPSKSGSEQSPSPATGR